VLLVIINALGVTASAGMGVAEKLCAFIMLVPSAFSGALSAFVAQNMGAKQPVRARRALLYGILASLSIGVVISYLSFFHGEMLAAIFSRNPDVNLAAADYLKGYAIDVLLTSFLFCFIGYFNGCGNTTFVMLQGLIGAFGVRIPVSWLMRRLQPPSLFCISLATPASTLVQILLFAAFLWWTLRRERREGLRQE
jgi:Na+-driven multidrug efflux pump